jgi:hypothetical protein
MMSITTLLSYERTEQAQRRLRHTHLPLGRLRHGAPIGKHPGEIAGFGRPAGGIDSQRRGGTKDRGNNERRSGSGGSATPAHAPPAIVENRP